MPIIRTEFANFVTLWNNHVIRKQKGKDYVVSGKPFVLYHLYPTAMVPDFKVPVEGESWRKVQAIVEQDGIDLEEYLPSGTMEVCDRIVRSFGGIPQTLPAIQRTIPYIDQYRKLRMELAYYVYAGHEPKLEECGRDTLGAGSVRTFFERFGIDVDVGNDIVIE